MAKLLPFIWARTFVPVLSKQHETEPPSAIRDALMLDAAMNGIDDILSVSVHWPASRIARATWLYATGKLFVKVDRYNRMCRDASGGAVLYGALESCKAHHVLALAIAGLCWFSGENDAVYQLLDDSAAGLRVEGSLSRVFVEDLDTLGLVGKVGLKP